MILPQRAHTLDTNETLGVTTRSWLLLSICRNHLPTSATIYLDPCSNPSSGCQILIPFLRYYPLKHKTIFIHVPSTYISQLALVISFWIRIRNGLASRIAEDQGFRHMSGRCTINYIPLFYIYICLLYSYSQWEFQDPKMEVPYNAKFCGNFPVT